MVTPLQNSLGERFNLLHFIDSKEINAKELEEEYGDGSLTNKNASRLCFPEFDERETVFTSTCCNWRSLQVLVKCYVVTSSCCCAYCCSSVSHGVNFNNLRISAMTTYCFGGRGPWNLSSSLTANTTDDAIGRVIKCDSTQKKNDQKSPPKRTPIVAVAVVVRLSQVVLVYVWLGLDILVAAHDEGWSSYGSILALTFLDRRGGRAAIDESTAINGFHVSRTSNLSRATIKPLL